MESIKRIEDLKICGAKEVFISELGKSIEPDENDQRRNLAFYKESGQRWTVEEFINVCNYVGEGGLEFYADDLDPFEEGIDLKWLFDNGEIEYFTYIWDAQEDDTNFSNCRQVSYESIFLIKEQYQEQSYDDLTNKASNDINPSKSLNGLTQEEEHILVTLSEECLEISKEIHKILRFGLDSFNPYDSEMKPNKLRLALELIDLVATADLAEEFINMREILEKNGYDSDQLIDSKQEKIKKFYNMMLEQKNVEY